MPRPVSIFVYMLVAGFFGKLSALIFAFLGAPEWAMAVIAGSVGYSAASLMEIYVDRHSTTVQEKTDKDSSIVGQ